VFAHLHARSWFSFLGGGSPPEALAARAAELGMEAIALTDTDGLYGAVRFAKACRQHGVRPIFGAEVRVGTPSGNTRAAPGGHQIVLLAESHDGYANLCRLLSAAHLRCRDLPVATIDEMAAHAGGLFCLTGGRGSLLWALLDAERDAEARTWVATLGGVFGERLSVEAAHHLCPGDARRVQRIARLAHATSVPLVATSDARHATAEDYRRYDLLTCVRLGQTVFDPHPERPRNGEAYLKAEDRLRRLIPFPDAFARASEVADACRVDLLPGHITPPGARLPEGAEPVPYLRALCEAALPERYSPERRRAAHRQLEHELSVISRLELEEFFLVVREVVEEARRRGIRCAGRGSAANSLVAYLLGITGVDPLAHGLLFERFLHTGRAGTPDIDVDFDSERRHEIIEWMEERFGVEHTAMTATLTTYRLRSALRDVAKALGWDLDTVNRLSKAVPPERACRVRDHLTSVEQVLGRSSLVEPLIGAVEGLHGCPRHLGLHSGGMVLSRPPLAELTPVQVSANGVKMVQFDKDDVEALGLVKLDVLGLRMLAALSEADELIRLHHSEPDRQGYPTHASLDDLPLDDGPTFELIREGRTLGCFQIESQGQLHLLAQHQPETFNDLITEIALFRPGPLQGNMVHPFVRRRKGLERVTYDHPDLEPILRDTYGVILFQEQVLEVAHRFAGMPLDEADEFRKLMSKFRDPGQMEAMRERFVGGAAARGVPGDAAQAVFEKVSKFVGYGFCRSHAAAFAKTVYQSCYLKRHHPAAFMAALMQHRPGMYNLQTLQQEARRMGVETRPPDVRVSGVRYALEPAGDARCSLVATRAGALAIRMPLTAVRALSAEHARAVVWERLQAPFASLEDFYVRAALPADAVDALARSGALDALAGAGGEPAGDARRALWEIGVLRRRLGPAGQRPTPALFDLLTVDEADVPALPALTDAERLSWDLHAHDAARAHPMTLVRRTLTDLEVRPIEACYRLGRVLGLRAGGPRPVVTIAGLAVLRQRPPTANGVLFLLLEDETGFVQCIVRPDALEHLDHVLRSGAIIARGRLLGEGNWRGLLLTHAWPLDGAFGGYEGHPSMGGGLDRRLMAPAPPRSRRLVATSSDA
jgi:error-prone DNA polymerase